jgi:DNA invertase Pin-like site-specific DNA recombinase
MKAAIYARVSTKVQDDAIQLADLQGFVKRWGWEETLYEDKLSGKQGYRRPALEKLLNDARQKKIDVVLTYKMDRFGRSVKDFCNNLAVLDNAGIRFVVPAQNIDTDKNSPIGRFTIHILMAVAELERSFIVERTQAGQEAYRKAYEEGPAAFKAYLSRRPGRHSKSGKDLPCGRPRRIFPRDKARKLREGGMSWRAIAARLKVPVSTIRGEIG